MSHNTIANYMAKNAGKPQVSGMVAAKNLVDGELAKVVSGSGQPTDALRKEFDDAFNSSSSPAQAAEVLDTYIGLMGGRVDLSGQMEADDGRSRTSHAVRFPGGPQDAQEKRV